MDEMMEELTPKDNTAAISNPEILNEMSENRKRFISIFEHILKRTPDVSTIQYHLGLLKTLSMADICLGLVESEEAQRQSRPATSSVPGSLIIIMITRTLDQQVRDILGLLQASLLPTDHIKIINRSHSSEEFPVSPQVSLLLRPGATVFECRAELAQLGGDYEWLALIEDHDIPVDGWMGAAKVAITGAEAATNYISDPVLKGWLG